MDSERETNGMEMQGRRIGNARVAPIEAVIGAKAQKIPGAHAPGMLRMVVSRRRQSNAHDCFGFSRATTLQSHNYH